MASGGVGASAVVWRGHEVLLVRGQRADDADPVWVLPGGQVEDDELAHEAVVREVQEEAGIRIHGLERLLFVSQHDYVDHPRWGGLYTAFTFEARVDAAAVPRSDDPHGIVDAAEFVLPGEAIRRLSRLEFGPMRDPVIAHLRGEAGVRGLWLWRMSVADGEHRPLAVIPLSGAAS
jgi:8-oxo-dGTP diphosphatase